MTENSDSGKWEEDIALFTINQQDKIKKLEAFFDEIALMTLHHDAIQNKACVTADRLGKAMEKVDPEWYNVESKKS